MIGYALPADTLTWSADGLEDWDGDGQPNQYEVAVGTDPRIAQSDSGGGDGQTENPTEDGTEDATEDGGDYSDFQTEQQTEEQTEEQTEQQSEDATENQTYDVSDYYTYDQVEEEEEDAGTPTSNYGSVAIPVSPKLSATEVAGEIREFAASITISEDVDEVKQAVAECLEPDKKKGWSLDPDVLAAVNQAVQEILEKIRQHVQTFEANLPSRVDAAIADLQTSIDSKAPKIVISDNWVPNEDKEGGKWNNLNAMSISTSGFEAATARFKVGFEAEVTAGANAVFVEGGAKFNVKAEIEAEVKVELSAVNPMDPNPLTSEQATVGAVPKFTWTVTRKGVVEAGVKLDGSLSVQNSKRMDLKTGTIERGIQK